MNTQARKSPAKQPTKFLLNRRTIIFATVCTKGKLPVLASDPIVHEIRNSWAQADAWIVGKYVIMPDHIHFFAAPKNRDGPDFYTWISYWKRICSQSESFAGLPRPIWQRGVWDRQLRSNESYTKKWDYVQNNPVRHDLVSDPKEWPYQGTVHHLDWYPNRE